jgi:phosphosulfolactate synthase (CoM biosynthesis protein A)
MKPKELEKRLSVAYDAGFFDGYCKCIETIHGDWVEGLKKAKGIGPVLTARIMKEMSEFYSTRRSQQGGDEEARKAVAPDTL